MKLKNKILLAASGLLILSGAAATTGTFAWFTVNTEATMSGTAFKVSSDTNELKIKSVSINGTALEDTNKNDHETWTADRKDVKLNDVSGDGKAFFKAQVSKNKKNGDAGVGTVKSATELKKLEPPYVDVYTITFSASNTLNMGVFFSLKNSKITASGTSAADGNTNTLVGAVRVALLDDKNNLLGFWAPEDTFTGEGGNEVNYINNTKTNGTTDGTGKSSELKPLWSKAQCGDKASPDFNDAAGANTSSLGYLGTVSNAATKTITVRTWIEGQDPDCTNEQLKKFNSGTYRINIDMKFYGVSNGFNTTTVEGNNEGA